MGKIVIANFRTGLTSVEVYNLWQYDYGAILRIQGLHLPQAVEIHFCLQNTCGTALRRIGTTKDGVTDVVIPDSMLENGDTTQDYSIYAWVYLTDETSGSTERRITMKVHSRSKPEAFERPEDAELFREAIAAVNEASGRAETAEKSAESWAHGHPDYPERDEGNAAYYAGVAGKNASYAYESMVEIQRFASQAHSDADITAQNKIMAEQYNSQAAKSAENALRSEQNAKSSETAAQEAQKGAEEAEGQAELYAKQTSADREMVSADKTVVLSARDESITARNTAIENANIATNKADETEADKLSTEANKAATESNKEATAANLAESNRILQEQIQMLGTVPMIYAVTTLEELQAFAGAKEGDFGIIQQPRAMLFRYYTTGADGQPLTQPAWQWMTDLNITFTRESLLGVLNLAGISLTGSYTDLQDIPNRYNSPLVLDGTGDTVVWDYSQGDTAVVTLTEDKVLSIRNQYNGCVAVIQCYGALLDFSDTTLYNKSATMDYIEPLEAEHITYTLIYNAGKWDVTSLVYAGGEASE